MSDINITVTKDGNGNFQYSSSNSEVDSGGDIDLRSDASTSKTIEFTRGSGQSWTFSSTPISIQYGNSPISFGPTNEFDYTRSSDGTSFTLTDKDDNNRQYSYSILTSDGTSDPKIYNKR